jgi:hypothetical protein
MVVEMVTVCEVCHRPNVSLTIKDWEMLEDSQKHHGSFKVICSDCGIATQKKDEMRHIARFHTNPYSGSVEVLLGGL